MQKWALITGATAGIGEATSRRLAAAGYRLVLLGRRRERLEKLARELAGEGHLMAPLDLKDRAALESFVADHRDVFDQVEVLVNNAGLAKGVEKVQEARIEEWETMIDTNVKGLLYVTRLLLPSMIRRKKGHIVNLGSVAGRWTYPGGAVYCATKFAVRALTEGIRMDLLGTPLRVTNIEPGMVETEFSEVRLEDKEAAAALYRDMKPLTAEDIAETIHWVLERPPHVNIQEIVIFPTDQAAVGQVHRHRQ